MVDEETGDEVPAGDQVRGYEIEKDQSVVIDQNDIDNIALESTHILEVTSFTPRDKIDPVYFDKTYFLAAEDKPSEEAFGVIRQAMVRKKIAALSKVVLHDRDHIVLLEPRGAGMLATMMTGPTRCTTKRRLSDRPQSSSRRPKICWRWPTRWSIARWPTSIRPSSRISTRMRSRPWSKPSAPAEN